MQGKTRTNDPCSADKRTSAVVAELCHRWVQSWKFTSHPDVGTFILLRRVLISVYLSQYFRGSGCVGWVGVGMWVTKSRFVLCTVSDIAYGRVENLLVLWTAVLVRPAQLWILLFRVVSGVNLFGRGTLRKVHLVAVSQCTMFVVTKSCHSFHSFCVSESSIHDSFRKTLLRFSVMCVDVRGVMTTWWHIVMHTRALPCSA